MLLARDLATHIYRVAAWCSSFPCDGTGLVKLIRVEARGFRSYRELDLDFGGCQLIRICGKNGMGKSTIIESLGWAIFGCLRDGSSIRAATHRGPHSAMDASASWQQPLPWVRWTVEIKGQRLQIDRRRGYARIAGGVGQVIDPRPGPVTKYMVDQLGIDYNDLRATAWCLQGDVKRPIAMANQDRKHLIRRLLLGDGVSGAAAGNQDAEPTDMARRARQQLENARRNLEEATSDLLKAEEEESAARKRLDGLRERQMASLEQHSRHEVLLATIEGLERERDGLRQHLDDCAADLRGMRTIENRADRFDPSALNRAIGQLEEDLAERDRLETTVQKSRERRLVRNAAAKARGDWYVAVSDTLASAIARGQCSTCERRIRKRHSTLTEKLDNANAEAKKARLRSARTDTPGTEETELSDETRQLVRQIEERQARVGRLRYEHGYSKAAKSLLQCMSSQVAKQAELESRFAEVVRRIKRRKQELDANGYRDEEHQRLEVDVEKAESKWREARERAREKRKDRDRVDRECWNLAQTAVEMSAAALGVRADEDEVRSRLEEKMDEIVSEEADRRFPTAAQGKRRQALQADSP